SENAKKGAGVQRVFSLGDEIVLNTICELRKRNVEFEEIRARLRNGERIEVLPAINEPIAPENALEIYTEMKELRVQIADRDAEIERLRAELTSERSVSQERIIKLSEQIAVLKFQLDQLKGKTDDK